MVFALVFLASIVGAVGVDLRLSLNGAQLSLDRPFIDHTHQWPPELSWTVEGAQTDLDLRQTAFTVHVDGDRVGGGGGAMRHVIPAPTRSDAIYEIGVSVTLADGRTVHKTEQFRTALLGGFGNASWIGGGTLLRRPLGDLAVPPSSDARLVNATAYASGVGCFAITLDGQAISSSFMDPGWATLPTVRVTYRAFDVTSHFENTTAKMLQVALGMCKYGYQHSFCIGAHGATDVCKGFLMSLRLAYSDGTVRTVDTSVTDGLWSATTSANPIRYSHLFHGEQYDGTVPDTPAQWHPATLATFNTSEEGPQPVAADKALGLPVLLTMPPLAVSRTYTPVTIKKVGSATTPSAGPRWVFDMGANMAGFATLSVARSALVDGVPVVLKYAEVLKADGTVNMAWCRGKEGAACQCEYGNCANQTDTFIPKPASTGEGRITYTPSFTYHGFRYVQVEGLAANYTPAAADLTALFVHSAVRRTGNVSFANPVLDGIQQAIVQTQLSNLHFHPTDCPQREKRGWTGDAQFTSRQTSLNLDMRQLYGNWLQTMEDHDQTSCAINGNAPVFPQTNKDICCNPEVEAFGCDYTGIPNGTFSNPGGSVADVVPYMYVGGWPGDPSWASISAVLPYTVWKGGDDHLVADYYSGARRNVNFFLREAANADGLIEFGYYGDWLSLAKIDKPQVTSTAQIMATANLAEMALHLGKTDDATLYNATLHRLRAAYHAKYWNATAKSYQGGTQTANLMPLILDIPPPAERALATAAFIAKVQAAKNATDSGLVGASFVLQALVAAGRGDIALSMAMREEQPSWGHMVKQGPGTIWETWDDTTNSHNHPMFTASIGPYLYSIAGLDPSTWTIPAFLRRRDITAGGEEEITMHLTPDSHAVRVLGRASGRVQTLCGEVALEWRAVRGNSSSGAAHFAMTATVPHNCGHARVVLHVVPEEGDTTDAISYALCVGDYEVGQDGVLPPNVFGVRMARQTVEVVVGGGHSELKLGRCGAV